MEKIKCRVCGFEWTPTKEDHYVARADQRHVSLFANGDSETALYDAWDCPVCGAQFAAEGRKRTVEKTAEGPVGITVTFGGGNGGNGKPYEDIDTRVQDECEGCKFVDNDGDVYPCVECSRNYYDRYREEKKDGAE